VQSQAFLKMDGETLARHLSQNTLRTVSEFQLLMCVNKWLHSSPVRLANDAARLLLHSLFSFLLKILTRWVCFCIGILQYIKTLIYSFMLSGFANNAARLLLHLRFHSCLKF
jgi:hypothetical protein